MPRGVEVEASGRAGGARRGGAKVQAQGVVVGGLARGVAQAAAQAAGQSSCGWWSALQWACAGGQWVARARAAGGVLHETSSSHAGCARMQEPCGIPKIIVVPAI